MDTAKKLPVILILILIVTYISAIGSILLALLYGLVPAEYLEQDGSTIISQYGAAAIALLIGGLGIWAIVLTHFRKKLARVVLPAFILISIPLGEIMTYLIGPSDTNIGRIGYILDIAMILYLLLSVKVKDVLEK